jgi:predicted porin
MKKFLIACSVLGAVSGAAMAQSSVTLYGVADIAIGKARSVGDQKWGLQSNTFVTNGGGSRIGLIGKEDLGNGLWAGFKFSGDVNLLNGASAANSLAGGNGPTWERSAYVALGSNDFGTLRLGRNYSPGFTGQVVYELTGWANYSVVAATYGFGGYFDLRNNAQIEYSTPSIYGVSAEFAYVPKAEGAFLFDGKNNQTDLWAMNVVYNQGPVKAAFTANKLSHTQTGGNANKVNWTLGGSYTFGTNFVLAASYNRTNYAMKWRAAHYGETNGYYSGYPIPQAGFRRYGWELGGSLLLDPFTLTLDLTRDTKNEAYGNNKKYTNGVLEGKYAVSKRTFLYADYLRLDGDNNFGVGIHHSF